MKQSVRLYYLVSRCAKIIHTALERNGLDAQFDPKKHCILCVVKCNCGQECCKDEPQVVTFARDAFRVCDRHKEAAKKHFKEIFLPTIQVSEQPNEVSLS